MKITRFIDSRRPIGQVDDLPLEEALLLPFWSPALFEGGYRRNENFLEAGAVGFDLDQGQTEAEVLKALDASGLRFALGASRNHQREKDGVTRDRMRLMVELAEPVRSLDEYTAAQSALRRQLGLRDDPAAQGAARGWYACREVLAAYEGAPYRAPPYTPGPAVESHAHVPRPAGLRSDLVNATEYVKRVKPVEPGFVGPGIFCVASDLVRGYGLSEDQAVGLMLAHWKNDEDVLREEHSAGTTEGKYRRACERAAAMGRMAWGYLLKDAPPDAFDVPMSAFLTERIEPPSEVIWKLQSGQMAFMYGGPNSCKTWLALELCRQAAERGKRILYVVEEGHPAYLQSRFRRMGLAGEVFRVATRKGFRLLDKAWADTLVKRIAETKTDLVILDPLSDILDGVNESAPEEMHKVREALKAIVATGVCLLVLHHSSKFGSRQSGQADQGPAMENMRGHSILAGAADLMVELRRESVPPDEPTQSMVEVTKNRNGPLEFKGLLTLEIDDRTARVDFRPGEDGQRLREARKQARKDVKATRKEDAAAEEEAHILTCLRARGQANISKLATLTGVKDRRVSAILHAWEEQGRVTHEGRDWRLV